MYILDECPNFSIWRVKLPKTVMQSLPIDKIDDGTVTFGTRFAESMNNGIHGCRTYKVMCIPTHWREHISCMWEMGNAEGPYVMACSCCRFFDWTSLNQYAPHIPSYHMTSSLEKDGESLPL